MRTWVFVNIPERCGFCGDLIPQGSAAQQIILHGVNRKRYRGECCAGAAPPELPASPVLAALPKLDLSRIDPLIPTRTRGALKSMAKEHLAPESESPLPTPLPRRRLSNLQMDAAAPVDRWTPHRNA